MDKEGKMVGPHGINDILALYYNNQLEGQTMVRRGGDGSTIGGGGVPLLPLISHIEALRSYPRELEVVPVSEGLMATKLMDCRDPYRQFTSWSFNVFTLERHELYPFCWALFDRLQLPDIFDFSPTTFWNLMAGVEYYMTRHNNPYHNFYHAADVCHACFVFLHQMDGAKLVNELEVLACMVAALCHDLDHPGETLDNIHLPHLPLPFGTDWLAIPLPHTPPLKAPTMCTKSTANPTWGCCTMTSPPWRTIMPPPPSRSCPSPSATLPAR